MLRHPKAAIDLGTNTARLLIGFNDPGGTIQCLLVKRAITRLGGGFTEHTGISLDASLRCLNALRGFSSAMKDFRVDSLRAVATSAVRDARNRDFFCAEILQQTGIPLEIIDSSEEGLLTLRGVLAAIDESEKNLFVFDVGGGSTEYMLALNKEAVFISSLPMGVVRLTEGKKDIDAMENKIIRELEILKSELKNKNLLESIAGASLVGTAGTVTTLAAISLQMIDYDCRKINNYTLSVEEIKNIFSYLLPMKPKDRIQVPGLEKGREDLIIAGMLITILSMEMFGFRQLKVSDFGLLEGVFLGL